MICIANFNNSRDFSDIEYYYKTYRETNINFLLNGFSEGKIEWAVPAKAIPGDIVIFMCAKEARHNLGLATSRNMSEHDQDFLSFIDEQKELYKKYSGSILGYGVVSAYPEYDDSLKWWMTDIHQLCQFQNPIHIDEFRSFIKIMRGTFTVLKDDQWNRLKWVANLKNPGVFKDVLSPEIKALEQEFAEKVKKEESKDLRKLEKEAKKKANIPEAHTVQTKVYQRDPTIAAYVKRRANGRCQLCGQIAPFNDVYGDPYLECHHIDWISVGGIDAADNCVALCPNCHRKMHIVSDPCDVERLKTIAKNNTIYTKDNNRDSKVIGNIC